GARGRTGPGAGGQRGGGKSGHQLAGGRPEEIGRPAAGRRAQPPGRLGARRRRAAVPIEPSRHAEVDVDDEAAAPVVEEVLPVGLGAEKLPAVETPRLAREPALRGGRADAAAGEVARVLPRETVDGVALGHAAPIAAPSTASGCGAGPEAPGSGARLARLRLEPPEAAADGDADREQGAVVRPRRVLDVAVVDERNALESRGRRV